MKKGMMLVLAGLLLGLWVNRLISRPAMERRTIKPEKARESALRDKGPKEEPKMQIGRRAEAGRIAEADGLTEVEEESVVGLSSITQLQKEQIDTIRRCRDIVDKLPESARPWHRYQSLLSSESASIAAILDAEHRGIPISGNPNPVDYPVYEGEKHFSTNGKWYKFGELEFPEFTSITAKLDEFHHRQHGSIMPEQEWSEGDILEWLDILGQVDSRIDQAIQVLSVETQY